MKRKILALVTCISILNCLCMSAYAETKFSPGDFVAGEIVALRASGSFDLTVKAHGNSMADTAFPLESGETVRIYATFSPSDADIDIGLVDSDKLFHYVRAKDGVIDQTIVITTRDNYSLAIRNNSGQSVRVVGFVKY